MSGNCEGCGETGGCVCQPVTNEEQLSVLIACLPNAPFKDRMNECIAKLKQERDELAAQVSGMQNALDELEGYARNFSVSGVYLSEEVEGRRLLDKAVDAATITGPDALREIQARTLEELKHAYTSYMTANLLSGLHWNEIEAIADEMAAAKRQGE